MATKRKPWTKVNTRKRPWTNEDGEQVIKDVTLYLDPRETPTFCFEVPDYVVQALGVPDVCHAKTADQADIDFKALMQRYHVHMKTAKAEPVILVKLSYYAVDTDGRGIAHDNGFIGRNSMDIERMVGLSYRLAFRVNGHIHQRDVSTWTRDQWNFHHGGFHREVPADKQWPWGDEQEHTVEKVGHRIPHPQGTVLDYTPELHQRLDAIVAALDQAAQVLHGLNQAKKGGDMAAAIMALGGGQGLLAAPGSSS
jgi:hypothetical protein